MELVKRFLLILLFLGGIAYADSDTLLTCKEYGFRVANILNLADTVNGNDVVDSGTIQKSVRMAFNEIGRGIAIPKSQKITLVSGTRRYFVDNGLTDISFVARIRNKSSSPLNLIYPGIETDTDWEDKILSGDTVQFYSVHGDSIRIFPTASYTDTIEVDYFARPAHPDASSDTVNIPVKYRDALIFLAGYYCEVKRGGMKKQLYWDEYMRIRQDLNPREIINK